MTLIGFFYVLKNSQYFARNFRVLLTTERCFLTSESIGFFEAGVTKASCLASS